jgi:Transglutaminase-like superfamily
MEDKSNVWIRRLKKFARVPLGEKLLLIEAALLLALARIAIRIMPFRNIAPHLGHARAESPPQVTPEQAALAKKIGWAVVIMSRSAFWDTKCLVQAIAAQIMLKRRGIPSTLYLGVAKDETRDLIAHAWVRSGSAILTGAAGHSQFTVVSSFEGC